MPHRKRHWPQVLLWGCGRDGFTAGDVQELLGFGDDQYGAAAQLLRRMQDWGYLRVEAFEAPARRNPPGGGGRTRKVYVVTLRGRARAKRLETS